MSCSEQWACIYAATWPMHISTHRLRGARCSGWTESRASSQAVRGHQAGSKHPPQMLPVQHLPRRHLSCKNVRKKAASSAKIPPKCLWLSINTMPKRCWCNPRVEISHADIHTGHTPGIGQPINLRPSDECKIVQGIFCLGQRSPQDTLRGEQRRSVSCCCSL